MFKIYGIPNCDSVKKAKLYFESHAIAYEFINFKKTPVGEQILKKWLQQKPWDVIMNKKGTSFRNLTPEQKEQITSVESALPFLIENNSLIKRPIIELNEKIVLIGYNELEYDQYFQ